MGYGVLIIEDEAILAKNIKLFLGRVGYDVKIAETAEDGLAQLEVFKPEVVLLDFNLPAMSEIGDMEPQSQSKLLKLLEDKTVRRLGSVRDSTVNVRIIAATHQPLEELVAAGRFRSDLFFRLRIVHITVPALRNRGSDILLLANHFLALHARRYAKNGLRLSAEVERQLVRHHWPGNVRELRNVIEHAVLMSSDSLIDALNLFAAPPTRSLSPSATVSFEETSLAALEREALFSALEKTNWNVSKAARVLGISRDTLRYRIAKFQLSNQQ